MMSKAKYSVIIQWSEEDQVYVVTLPEWGGLHTHGSTYEEAAKHAQEVLESLIEAEERADGYLPAAHEFMFPGPSGFSYEFTRSAATQPNKKPALKKKVRHATA
jgi:predicted RNase H-like HicB family nuclease